MTWKEFKARVKEKGVKEDSEIWTIDLTGWSGKVEDIRVTKDDEGSYSVWSE